MDPIRASSAAILEYYPQMGSTALFMEHVRGDVPIAATNGRQVIYGEAFYRFARPEQNGITLHEYLHCVLSHPQRAALVRMVEKDQYCPTGFNVAADAIINHAIRADSNRLAAVALPDGCVEIRKLSEDLQALGIIDKEISACEANVEEVYRLLMKARRSSRPDKEEEQSRGRGLKPLAKQQEAWDRIAEWFEDEADLQADSGTADELKDRIRERTARLAAEATMHGSSAGDLLERIRGDIPKSRVNWESSFRTVTARHLSRERQRTPSRPSNAMLSHEAMGGAKYWEPGRRRMPRPRALVIADSSGSISMDEYLKFLGELDGMRRRTGATLLFAHADTILREPREITQTTSLRDISLEGRGGTCFIKPLAAAEAMDVDLVIYMTDLDGPFPEDCRVPVIWVSPEDRRKADPPFGRHFRV